jgi:hexosaminidase
MYKIIPRPKELHSIDSSAGLLDVFSLTGLLYVMDEAVLELPVMIQVQEELQGLFRAGEELAVQQTPQDHQISCTQVPRETVLGIDRIDITSWYGMKLSREGIEIMFIEPEGALYAVQTLKQILHTDRYIDPVEIIDYSIYSWRGLMLDCSRHFFSVEIIMRLLDAMALQKLNRFHWHLTDDQGWRLQLTCRPRLTEIGSIRSDTRTGGRKSATFEGIPHAGFYTAEDVRVITSYASARGIVVIPEIDLPGHASAAIAAYPELSCRRQKLEVPTTFGIFDHVLCVGSRESMDFVREVIREVCTLFPGPWVHIGGDEVPTTQWESCRVCADHMKEHGIGSYRALQEWFTREVSSMVEAEGKIPIGWNEIIDGEITSEGPVVQFWMPLKGRIKRMREAISTGRSVILSEYFHAYLDQSYAVIPLKKAYRLVPRSISRDLSDDSRVQDAVLGFEMPIWSEWIDTPDRLFWQTFPRSTAMADRAWDGLSTHDYHDFLSRLETFLPLLHDVGVGSAKREAWAPPILRRLRGFGHLSDDTAAEQRYYEQQ